jgi:hypothetical protein
MLYNARGLVPSRVKALLGGSYALYGAIILVVIILVMQPASEVAYNIMGYPSTMILMLFVAGIGIAALGGATMIKGTFMSSSYAKYFTSAMGVIFLIAVTMAFISFGKYGGSVMTMAIIISVFSFVALGFQNKSMF